MSRRVSRRTRTTPRARARAAALLRRGGLSEAEARRLAALAPRAAASAAPALPIRRVWSYRCLVGEPWAPTRLNVILTGAPPPPPPEAREAAASARTRYARWVTDGFDLAHCAIALDVDARTGAWRFEARERSCRALMARRLEALPECFARAGRCAASARRVLGALDLGFSLEGDGGWPDDAAARAALRAVA